MTYIWTETGKNIDAKKSLSSESIMRAKEVMRDFSLQVMNTCEIDFRYFKSMTNAVQKKAEGEKLHKQASFLLMIATELEIAIKKRVNVKERDELLASKQVLIKNLNTLQAEIQVGTR